MNIIIISVTAYIYVYHLSALTNIPELLPNSVQNFPDWYHMADLRQCLAKNWPIPTIPLAVDLCMFPRFTHHDVRYLNPDVWWMKFPIVSGEMPDVDALISMLDGFLMP